MCQHELFLYSPHSSSSLFSATLFWPLVCRQQRAVMEDGWSECVRVCENDTDKRDRRNMASIQLSGRAVHYEWNTSGVSVWIVFVRKRDGGETKSPREICVHQTGRQRDGETVAKMEERRKERETDIARVGDNLFSLRCLFGWCALPPPQSKHCISSHSETQKQSRLNWYLGLCLHWTADFYS